mmetsp:Transcript_1470/g.1656  ORF Transcript_1470/g.1656 Transcript_1470/m.1656 type:complete len:444 (+) Transcript_1470:42-1373(+)
MMLLNLPNEVLAHILSYLQVPGAPWVASDAYIRSDVLQVEIVSLQMRELTEFAWHCMVNAKYNLSKKSYEALLRLGKRLNRTESEAKRKYFLPKKKSKRIIVFTHVGWKYLYFNKTRLQNHQWTLKKIPAHVIPFLKGFNTVERTAHPNHLFPTCVTSNDKYIVAGSGAYETFGDPTTFLVGFRRIHLWDKQNNPIASIDAHVAAVTNVAIHQKRNLLISSAKDGIVKLWNLDNYKLMHEYHQMAGLAALRHLQICDDVIVACTTTGNVMTLSTDVNAGSVLSDFNIGKNHGSIRSLHVNENIMCCSYDKQWSLWDLSQEKMLHEYKTDVRVYALHKRDNLVVVSTKTSIDTFDDRASVMKPMRTVKLKYLKSPPAIQLVFDDNKIVYSNSEGYVTVIDWNLLEPLNRIMKKKYVTRVRFSLSDNVLLTATSDKYVRVWDFNK